MERHDPPHARHGFFRHRGCSLLPGHLPPTFIGSPSPILVLLGEPAVLGETPPSRNKVRCTPMNDAAREGTANTAAVTRTPTSPARNPNPRRRRPSRLPPSGYREPSRRTFPHVRQSRIVVKRPRDVGCPTSRQHVPWSPDDYNTSLSSTEVLLLATPTPSPPQAHTIVGRFIC